MGKKICITGASRGIGLSEARKLAKNNELFLVASKLDSFDEKDLGDCHLFGADITNDEDRARLSSDIERKTDSLDILVNNVGLMVMKPFAEMNEEEIDRQLNVNLRANLLLTRRLLPLLLKSPSPQIIFMSSMAAKSGIVGESIYAAAKAGLTNFANVLRNELAGQIRISTIHSWGVDTQKGTPEGIPLLRPENIAEILEFIISRERPFLVESIEVSHERQWRGGQAPWSPK